MDNFMINNGKRNYWTLDVLKIILAIIVILRHCGQSFTGADPHLFYYIVTNTISPIAVPAFFIISGFLLFRKDINKKVIVTQIKRLMVLYLVWSIIYMPFQFIKIYSEVGPSIIKIILKYLQMAIFDGTYYHLWFLPALMISICIVFFLNKYVHSTKISLVIVAILYITGLLTDTYTFLFPQLQIVTRFYRAIFLTTRNGIFFGAIFVYIGKCVADNEENIKKFAEKYFILGFVVSVVFMFVESYFLCVIHNKAIINMNVNSLLVSSLLVLIAIRLDNGKPHTRSSLLRNMSTILFCCHPTIIIVVEYIGNKIDLSLGVKILVVLIVSIVISYVCVCLSEKFKIVKCLF